LFRIKLFSRLFHSRATICSQAGKPERVCRLSVDRELEPDKSGCRPVVEPVSIWWARASALLWDETIFPTR